MMRLSAKAGLVTTILAIVGVVQGCSAAPAAKKNGLALGEDEATAKDKDDPDEEGPATTGESIELGPGTKGTEPDPEKARTEGGDGDDATSSDAPAVCTGDAQCNQAGRICTNGSCVKGCRKTAGCPTNQICTAAGQCTFDDANVECYWDYDCEYGTICSTTDKCIPGCYTSADCPTGQTCTTAGQCKAATTTPGTTPTTVQCVSDGQCNPGINGAGLICSAQGACVPGCHRDNQCPGSKICDKGVCK